MIQRKQTIFLFVQVLACIMLLFVNSESIMAGEVHIKAALVVIDAPGIRSTASHQAAVLLNFLILALVSASIFYTNAEFYKCGCVMSAQSFGSSCFNDPVLSVHLL